LAQAKEFGGPNGRCTLIGGGTANVVYATLYNTALVRYIDFMDSFLAGPELCHPSDNTGAVLGACEHAGRSGKEFLTALAVAYQVQSMLTASAPFMERGFDLTTALPYSVGAGVAKALALDEVKTAAAIKICGQTGFQLLVARTTPISQWKGLTSSQVAFGCVNAVFLASRGVTGPKYVIEGSCGLAQALDQAVNIDWKHAKLDCFGRRTRMSERRRSSRCLRGRLYFFRNGRKSQRCLILDAFYEGARIVVDNPARIPDEIDLYIPKKRRFAHAKVRWRHGRTRARAFRN